MKKKFTYLLFVVCLISLLLPVGKIRAAESGACGEGVTWVLDTEGTLTISGSGTINTSEASWKAGSIKKIRIENGIAGIGDGSFAACSALASITVPGSVTYIGADAIKPSEKLVIYCETGSAAEAYAKEHQIPYQKIGSEGTEEPNPPQDTQPTEPNPPQDTQPTEPNPPQDTQPTEPNPPQDTQPTEPNPPQDTQPTEPNPPQDTQPEEPDPPEDTEIPPVFIKPGDLSPINDVLWDWVLAAEKRQWIEIEVPGTELVRSEVLLAAKEKDVQLSVISQADATVVWKFEHIIGERHFDPLVSIGVSVPEIETLLTEKPLPETTKYTQVSFLQTGTLPGTAKMTLTMPSEVRKQFTKGDTLHLYYFNPKTNLFEEADTAEYKGGSSITFIMTHCSDYIITNETLPELHTTGKEPEIPSETQPSETEPEETMPEESESMTWEPEESEPEDTEDGSTDDEEDSEEEHEFSEKEQQEFKEYLAILLLGLLCMIIAVIALFRRGNEASEEDEENEEDEEAADGAEAPEDGLTPEACEGSEEAPEPEAKEVPELPEAAEESEASEASEASEESEESEAAEVPEATEEPEDAEAFEETEAPEAADGAEEPEDSGNPDGQIAQGGRKTQKNPGNRKKKRGSRRKNRRPTAE